MHCSNDRFLARTCRQTVLSVTILTLNAPSSSIHLSSPSEIAPPLTLTPGFSGAPLLGPPGAALPPPPPPLPAAPPAPAHSPAASLVPRPPPSVTFPVHPAASAAEIVSIETISTSRTE